MDLGKLLLGPQHRLPELGHRRGQPLGLLSRACARGLVDGVLGMQLVCETLRCSSLGLGVLGAQSKTRSLFLELLFAQQGLVHVREHYRKVGPLAERPELLKLALGVPHPLGAFVAHPQLDVARGAQDTAAAARVAAARGSQTAHLALMAVARAGEVRRAPRMLAREQLVLLRCLDRAVECRHALAGAACGEQRDIAHAAAEHRAPLQHRGRDPGQRPPPAERAELAQQQGCASRERRARIVERATAAAGAVRAREQERDGEEEKRREAGGQHAAARRGRPRQRGRRGRRVSLLHLCAFEKACNDNPTFVTRLFKS